MSTPRRTEVADRAPTPFSVQFAAGHGALIARVAGDIDLASAVQFSGAVLATIEERGGEGVILDFTEVGFMDSTGMRALLDISRRLALRPYSLVILAPNRSVRKLLALAGLDERIPVAATITQAESQLHSAPG